MSQPIVQPPVPLVADEGPGRTAVGTTWSPALLPRSVTVERRLTNRALATWQAAPPGETAAAMAPFFDHSLVVADPAGRAVIESVGGPVAARFGLVAGLPLLRDPGLGEELVAACELVALQPMPIPFEASVNDPIGAQILVRGLALPLPLGDDPAALVQVVLSWREVLSKSAARRLQAELAQAFASLGPAQATAEPFPTRSANIDVIKITKNCR
ncbi:hypothetical protein CHU93_01945 [Sandarakinorhabdus cyanobacteriorum]|uniref:Uncharacterized protein n=1 Tax=Sandarakinorhabdus cyanobacteriorum TaxID=1981098 RepID=A0A255Z0X2_9SPHN|nr:hypothetical protein CHU93_01945 [Sandarakinorhabdus cyanobacteriorum]